MERRPPAEGRPTGDCTSEDGVVEGVCLEEMVVCTVCATLNIRIESNERE